MGTTIPTVSPAVTIEWHTAPVSGVPAVTGMEGVESSSPVEDRVVTRGERDVDE
jgi:hypothetical protein